MPKLYKGSTVSSQATFTHRHHKHNSFSICITAFSFLSTHLFISYSYFQSFTMSIPEINDVLRFEAYKPGESDSAVFDISWSQTLRTKSATYYVVKAKNTTKSNADVLLYVQDRFYKDPSSPDYIGNIPGVQQEAGKFLSYPTICTIILTSISQETGFCLSPTEFNTVRRTPRARSVGSSSTTKATSPTR